MTVLSSMRRFLNLDSASGIDFILTESGKWKPAEYDTEIERRMKYLDGDMEDDWEALLKLEFPTTWRDMSEKMLGYGAARFIIQNKAQAFKGKGQRFFLRDRASGDEINPASGEAKTFSDLCASSGLALALADADESVEIAHACALRVWSDRGKTRISHYDPHKVHLALNPDREWDPQSAMAVAFERPSKNGLNSMERYEVFSSALVNDAEGVERDSFGARVFVPDLHYLVDGSQKIPVNESNVNPFRDRLTGAPIYPFVWLTDVPDQVYYLGGDDLVMFNRLMNLGMTYLHHNMTWQMAAIPNFKYPLGSNLDAVVGGTVMSSPNRALSLPAGVEIEFVRPDVQIDPFISAYQTFMKFFALMNSLPGRSMDVQGGSPESGVAKMMEMVAVIKHRDEMVRKYESQVLELLEKMIIVHNTYASMTGVPIIPESMVGAWDAGVIDSGPADVGEIDARYKVEIENGVSSVDEWAAAVHGVDVQTASAMVDANVVRNAEVASKMTRYSPDLAEAIGKMRGGVEEESEEEPESEDQDEDDEEPEEEE